MNIQDGTLCRAESPKPGPLGADPFGPARPKRKITALVFDGAKVHDFLFHAALAEIQWRDLDVKHRAGPDSLVQKQRSLERASMLYDRFLEACSQGPNQATSFLAEQHDVQKKYLQRSQAILQSLQLKSLNDQVWLSEAAFGAQAVKSAATAGVAIIGLLLEVPEILAGAGIALGFDMVMETIKRLGSSHQANADTVVIGFKQTLANDAASVVGAGRQVSLDATKGVLEKTLSYPRKSSIYRSAAATGARLDILMKTLGGLSAAVTLYTEFNDSKASYEEMQRARSRLESGN